MLKIGVGPTADQIHVSSGHTWTKNLAYQQNIGPSCNLFQSQNSSNIMSNLDRNYI